MTRRQTLKDRCKNLGKPSYKPLVSYVSDRPPSQVQGPPRTLTPVEERAEQNIEESSLLTRDRFQTPPNEEVQKLLELHQKYLNDTGIEETFVSLCRYLLSLTNLPYNPYPGFVRRVRQSAENFHLTRTTSGEILKSLDLPTKNTRVTNLVTHSPTSPALGLVGVMKMVNPQIQEYQWLLHSLTPQKKTLNVGDGGEYTNTAVSILHGGCIFQGSLYAYLHALAIQVEYIISGADFDKALDLYAESVFRDLAFIERDTSHTILECVLPREGSPQESRAWTWEDIATAKEHFKGVIIEATKSKSSIEVKCVFRREEHGEVYILGSKMYALNFVKVNAALGSEEYIDPCTECPLAGLHTGIFLDLNHADSFMNAYSAPIKSKTPSRKSKQKEKPRGKGQTGGFLLEETHTIDPWSQDIVNPIKLKLKQNIASLHPQMDLFEALPYLMFLAVIDKDSYSEELIVELHKMAHSTAAGLHQLILQIKGMQLLFHRFKKISGSEIFGKYLQRYRETIMDFFEKMNQERSADMIESGRILLQRIDDLVEKTEESGLSEEERVRSALEELRRLEGYVALLQLQLVEDAYANCPKIKDVFATLKQSFPDSVPRSETPVREVSTKSEKAKKQAHRRGEGTENFPHGIEDQRLKKHSTGAIEVEANTTKESAPKALAKESVILKYIIDTRLDSIWPEFLIELLSGNSLPSNPYPRLVSTFEESVQRMDLFHESSEKLTKRLLHGAAREEDRESHTYNLPGADAHGRVCSLALVDSSVFYQIVALCQPCVTQNYVQKKGQFRIALCTGLSSHSSLYGRMAPYVTEIHLEEHCFIRGPDDGADQSIPIYTKMVNDNMNSLRQQIGHVVVGLFTGGMAIELNEIERHWREQHDVYIKVFIKMDWRYVVVMKHYKLHYINIEETSHLEYFPPDPSSYYLTVFFEGDKAAFYHRYSGPKVRGDPFSSANIQIACQAVNEKVIEANTNHDWINVHRWLLSRNVLTQGQSHVAEVWRMLHSIGAQFEYLLYLVNALIDIVSYGMQLLENNEEIDNYTLGGIDLKFLGRMIQAFRQKATEVTQKQIAITALCLPEIITMKTQHIIERLSDTREIIAILSQQTLEILNSLAGALEALRDTSAFDLHMVSQEAQTMIKAIVDNGARPSSSADQSGIANIYI